MMFFLFAGGTGNAAFPGSTANAAHRHPLVMGFNLLGPTLGYGSFFVQYGTGEIFLFETGANFNAAYGGFSVFPFRYSRYRELAPYMGLFLGYADPSQVEKDKGVFAYMPVGTLYRISSRWVVSAELAVTTAGNLNWGPIYAGVKLGFQLN